MQPITSVFNAFRAFWANDQQRKTIMWVIAAVSLVVTAYGLFQIADGQLEYMDLSDQLEKTTDGIDAYVAQFPTAEVGGETRPDLTGATQEELMILATMKREERETTNERVDAYNQRAIGVRIAGIGVIGLALAYMFAPERKRQDKVQDSAANPDQPPSDTPS